ncbi:hypothetical protein [Dinoroseobacter sp. S76]|uniref:hypothetical protein n=1 Tax=Dinoroseobacter sp. S76 TaxID=3415124 RepID=UPI003C79B86F
MEDAYTRGKALSERHNPGLEEALEARYGALLPGMPQDLIAFVYGQHYSRPGLSLRDRSLATAIVGALSTIGLLPLWLWSDLSNLSMAPRADIAFQALFQGLISGLVSMFAFS